MNDYDDFTRRLNAVESGHGKIFRVGDEIIITRAPGRLDVMGGVADYSGSLVAEATIGPASLVALQLRSDGQIQVSSHGIELYGMNPHVEISVDRLVAYGQTDDLAGLRRFTQASPGHLWAGYVLGCYAVLARERLLPAPVSGATLLIDSNVPIGAGMSSSAAIEVSTMLAISEAYGLGLAHDRLAALAQVVENEVVGAPCGIMDQMTCALGHADRLFLLLCRPHDVQGYQDLPDGVHVYGINSGVSHSVGGRPYRRARTAAFMGKRLVNDRRTITGERPLAYLSELTPAKYRRDYVASVPPRINGLDFAQTVGTTGDAVSTVEPDCIYPVRSAVEHAVYENQRVNDFVACLHEAAAGRSGHRALSLMRAGECMYASHWSYTRIGLGSRETTLLVRLAREFGLAKGVYGARITGGGSGGTVAVLCDGDEAESVVRQIADAYRAHTQIEPTIVRSGISDGAGRFGARRILRSSA